MTIKTRITLKFIFITSLILIAFAIVIYYSAKLNREREFYLYLKKEALTKANLFFEARIDPRILQEIYKNNRQILNEVEVAIYDDSFNLLYHDAVDIDFVKETHEMINEIINKGELRFYQSNWQVLAFKYVYNDRYYAVTAASYDAHGYNQLKNLRNSIVIFFIFSILILYFLGKFFSKKALEPVKRITERAKEISVNNLNLRIEYDNTNDELSELSHTFNEMMDRLQKSFDAQNELISNVAHELRTPLTAIVTELELSLLKDREGAEYKKIIKSVYGDSRKLVRLINGLLDFSRASCDPSLIKFKPIRIDEVLLDAKLHIQKIHNDYKVEIYFENYDMEQETNFLVNGNEYFLRVAFINLFENGCKYSHNKSCTANVIVKENYIDIKFIDEGIGISEDDLPNIFKPFYRGKNKDFIDGSGIGLALTEKIVKLHKGTITVNSVENKGSVFLIRLPNLSSF